VTERGKVGDKGHINVCGEPPKISEILSGNRSHSQLGICTCIFHQMPITFVDMQLNGIQVADVPMLQFQEVQNRV
jgi:hypothetical protein